MSDEEIKDRLNQRLAGDIRIENVINNHYSFTVSVNVIDASENPGAQEYIYVKPGLDKNGKNNAKIDTTGKVELPDGGDAIFPSQPDMGKVKVQLPEGSTIDPLGRRYHYLALWL